ncbi:tripartite motif-containing protein 14-like isoform X2 [Vombatus ursinus]|uniref:tripartite motif-containing protein 14-like isoform X2 n=1 Tax=Vombatus ursinus TaxID=29139 RepID=UPI000FFCF246|nr:tripartite motif-containing protein 14-like isoform X2 [Vombatus ursinus]XP_027695396.1 tripartite motif-containing protein 14-like isoform X2 [Vombatus ursinus]
MAMAAPSAAAAADPVPWEIFEAREVRNTAQHEEQRKPGGCCGRPEDAEDRAAAAAAEEEDQGRAGPELAPIWLCSEHRNRTVELFCSRCRRCVCALCPLVGSHRGHPVRFVHEEVSFKQKDIQKCLKQLALKKKQEASNINKVNKAANELEEYTASEKEMMQQMIPTELFHPIPVKFEHAKTYYRNLATAVFTTLQMPLDVRLKEDTCSQLSVSSQSKPGTLLKTTPTPERSLFLKYARIPTLEPDTMHSRLRLSDDRLTVTCVLIGKIQLFNPQRFDKLWQVLSRDSFFSGSHYWEVDLLKSGIGWWIGVAYSSIGRKGNSEASRLGFNRESWCLKRFDMEYWAFHNGERTRIPIDHDPERIGIFLDYEAGILSFYDMTCGVTHLHTFYSRFQEPLYPALRLWEGSITIRKLP